jgi:hypothetical protein
MTTPKTRAGQAVYDAIVTIDGAAILSHSECERVASAAIAAAREDESPFADPRCTDDQSHLAFREDESKVPSEDERAHCAAVWDDLDGPSDDDAEEWHLSRRELTDILLRERAAAEQRGYGEGALPWQTAERVAFESAYAELQSRHQALVEAARDIAGPRDETFEPALQALAALLEREPT